MKNIEIAGPGGDELFPEEGLALPIDEEVSGTSGCSFAIFRTPPCCFPAIRRASEPSDIFGKILDVFGDSTTIGFPSGLVGVASVTPVWVQNDLQAGVLS